jgi:signal transduction histidine kinase
MGRHAPTAARARARDDGDRAARREAAVRAERAQMARELHDVVAHDLSVMLVQAAAAKRMVPADPERSRSAIAAVAETGREAHRELRRLVAVLRRGDGELDALREPVDVVAEAVAAIVARAGAAGSALGDDPTAAVDALDAVDATGREALTEMRRLLAIVRPDGEDAAHSPQPSLERLGALVARSRDAGLDVELRIEGEPRPVALGVDITAFRLVQMALGNAREHGARGPARVTVRWTDELLELEVANRADRDGPAGEGQLGDHRLVRMRERAALCGGELRAGPAGRGFVVRARLPRD